MQGRGSYIIIFLYLNIVFIPVITHITHAQRVPPLRIADLIHDLRDGTKLLALLEVLSGEKLVSSVSIQFCIL